MGSQFSCCTVEETELLLDPAEFRPPPKCGETEGIEDANEAWSCKSCKKVSNSFFMFFQYALLKTNFYV